MDIKNKPLTVEELKTIKKYDWIWVIGNNHTPICGAKYVHIAGQTGDNLLYYVGGYPTSLAYADYGTEWIAYKNKEEAENADYGNVKQAVNEFVDILLDEFEKLKERYNPMWNWNGECAVGWCSFAVKNLKNKLYGEEKSCRTCKWHKHEEIDDSFVCCNGKSAKVTEWTEDNDCCELWEK